MERERDTASLTGRARNPPGRRVGGPVLILMLILILILILMVILILLILMVILMLILLLIIIMIVLSIIIIVLIILTLRIRRADESEEVHARIVGVPGVVQSLSLFYVN